MPPPATMPRIWAHRGLGGTPLENTLYAFETALDEGADGIELDIRACASGELVVFHDPTLTRLAGRPERVDALDLATLQAISWHGGRARIPTLEAAIALVCRRGAQLNVELKGDVADVHATARALHDLLNGLDETARASILVSSFHGGALDTLHALGTPRLALLLAHTAPEPLRVPPWAHAVHPDARLCTKDRVDSWRRLGLAVNVWTVNDAASAASLQAMGVDGLITDDVPGIRAALG